MMYKQSSTKVVLTFIDKKVHFLCTHWKSNLKKLAYRPDRDINNSLNAKSNIHYT